MVEVSVLAGVILSTPRKREYIHFIFLLLSSPSAEWSLLGSARAKNKYSIFGATNLALSLRSSLMEWNALADLGLVSKSRQIPVSTAH